MAKRAIMGLKGVTLAKVIKNTLTEYETEAATITLQHAAALNRTAKETSTDLYYDDVVYATVKEVLGEDVELRIAEVPLTELDKMGAGVYDPTKARVEANFVPDAGQYSLRCVNDTVDHLPFYFVWRVFDLTGFRLDNFATKNSGVTVCEVIISGVFLRPQLPTVKDYAYMILKEDKSNLADCDAFLSAAEKFPAGGGGGGSAVTVPGAPTGVVATPDDEAAGVAFIAPANDGGSSITGYLVRATDPISGTTVTEAGPASPITITGLTNGVAYDVTVSAQNTQGYGPESAGVTVTPS